MTEEREEVDLFKEWTTKEPEALTEALTEGEKSTTEILEGEQPSEEEVEKKRQEESDKIFADFLEPVEEKEGGEKPTDKKVEGQSSTNFLSTLKFLKEKGVLQYEEDPEKELTPEEAERVYLKSFRTQVEAESDAILGNLPQEVKDLNAFVLKGGNYKDYFAALVPKKGAISIGMDLEKEENQILLASQDFESLGYDSELIAQQIENLKNSGKLKSVAENRYKRFEQEDASRVEEVRRRRELEVQERLKEEQDFSVKTSSFFKEHTESYGVKFNEEEVKELPSYMTGKSVKLDNGTQITPLYRDLYSAIKDPKKFALLAKILKSDFDFSSMKKDISSELASELREKMSRASGNESRSQTRGF